MAMEWQGATYALSSSWILLLLYLQQSMSFPTQLPCQQCCKERAVDLIKAAREARVVINIMRAERGDPSVWKEVYERGRQIAAEFEIEPNMPRTTGRQQHRVNVPATNPESNWQGAVYLPLIDHLIQEMNDKFLSREDRFLAQ